VILFIKNNKVNNMNENWINKKYNHWDNSSKIDNESIILNNLAKEIAIFIWSDCSWNNDFFDSEQYYLDCITTSYLFHIIAKYKYNINVNILSWSLKEWLDDGDGDLLWIDWHYWCEYWNCIYDFTVSQFVSYIKYNNLYNTYICYWDYIFDKNTLNNIYLYTNGIDWLEKNYTLNNMIHKKIDSIDFSRNIYSILNELL
jgi:hypothetical protein